MKMKSMLSPLTATMMAMLLVLGACGSKPQSQPDSSAQTTGPRVQQLSEWETVVQAARKEGRVALYGSVIGDTGGQLNAAFRKKYGIDIEFFQGRGAEIIEKLMTERRAGLYVADVSIGGLTTYFNVTVPANISVSLEPMLMQDEVKDPAKWRAGKIPFLDKKKQVIALVSLASLYISVNKDMVKDGEITSFNDLLDPKWKGKIVINDPSSAGRGNSWFSYMMIQLHGKEKGAEYMKKLVANEPVIQRNERLQVEWLARGKYPVLVGAKPTEFQSFVNAGAPIKWVKVKEAAPLSSGSLNLNAFDKAPHPNAARVFVNWILSREAGEIIAATSGYPSERADVSREKFDPDLVPGPKDVLEDEDYLLQKSVMQKVAADIFKELLR